MKNAILYGFKFPHHGRYAGFFALSSVMKKRCRVICFSHPAFVARVFGKLGLIKLGEWVVQKWFELHEMQLKKYYRKPNVLVHHFFSGDSARYASRGKRAKTVITCHQPVHVMQAMVKNKDYNPYLEEFFDQADMLILMSDTELDEYQLLFPDKRIECIRHGVDVDFFSPPPIRSRGDEKFRILSVGSWLRDYKMWADVANKLAAKNADVEFVVLANKGMRAVAEEHCEPHVNVKWLSSLSDEELAEQYRDADLLFLSLEDAWANNALLEAMASGLPVVCTDLPATREYLGPDGIFVPKDADATVDVIESLIGDSEKMLKLGERLRRRACEAFSWEVVGEEHMRAYQSLLGENQL